MRYLFAIRSVLFSVLLLAMSAVSFGQIGFSITIAPPELPVYEQPMCPGDGYIWTPGYWGYGDDGYYWVAGEWVEAPEVGYLWTPGYWGWGGNSYAFHEGYWGESVGFYGGINYGYGYGGEGYEGGRWNNRHFEYNTSVNRINTENIHNTYNTRVVENNRRVSFNGGNGGVEARASARDEEAGRGRHIAPVAAQTSRGQEARSNPEMRASANHGNPSAAAVAKSEAGNRHGASGGNETVAPRNVAPHNDRPTENPATAAARPNAGGHASDLQSHKMAAPNSGNARTDQKYQRQQDNLAAKQSQDHQKLAQQQNREHQQLAKSNASEGQKQQVEQRHQQQTQQLEQKHAAQTQRVETRQQPARGTQSKPTETRPGGEKPH